MRNLELIQWTVASREKDKGIMGGGFRKLDHKSQLGDRLLCRLKVTMV